MPKYFYKNMQKKVSSQIISKKIKMRALWSQVKKHDFFDFLGWPFSKMDILKMSKIEKGSPNPETEKTIFFFKPLVFLLCCCCVPIFLIFLTMCESGKFAERIERIR